MITKISPIIKHIQWILIDDALSWKTVQINVNLIAYILQNRHWKRSNRPALHFQPKLHFQPHIIISINKLALVH